ncbi:MAG: hypothetical protein HFE82_07605 [Erysipelotrichaceae bacterium]|nr:hypothetical protein [Erysipelotrichaceae bacterium]
MANEENLIPVTKRTKSEAREISKKGGQASGAARRKKKSMKQVANYLLSLPAVEELQEEMIESGVTSDNVDNQTALVFSMLQRAIKGNVSAAQFIADITGNTAMTEVEREKIKLEKKRLKLEEAKLLNNDTTDDESVVIINDIEKESG